MKLEQTGKLLTKLPFALIIALLSWLIVYWPTLADMLSVWSSSETYTHCFLILPVVLYLLFEKKHELTQLKYQPFYWAIIPLIITQAVFIIANTIGINVLAHLSAYFSAIFLLWLILGTRFLIFAQFPLFFLVFAVPLGEELVPFLQQITADLSVVFIELAGVPVFRDGLYLHIPAGSFVVAEACAGIRFLIATIAIGALYSYLFFSSLKRRIIFMAVCVVIPIVANGIRAAGIVIIGHYSDMTHAVGADHLVYGWLFFSIVLGLIIIVGNVFQENSSSIDTEQTNSQKLNNSYSANESRALFIAPTVAGVVLIIASSLYLQWISKSSPSVFDKSLPVKVTSFATAQAPLWQPSFKLADTNIYLDDSKNNVKLFIAQYFNETENKELINWNNKQFDYDLFSISSRKSIQFGSNNAEILYLKNIHGHSFTLVYFYVLGDVTHYHSLPIKLAALKAKLQGESYTASIVQTFFEGEIGDKEIKNYLTAIIQSHSAESGAKVNNQ